MAYSESLAARIREALARQQGVAEKRMFGSVAFLLHGNLLAGVWKSSLFARVGPAAYDDALSQEHVREFDVTGRPMKGWILVEPEGVESDKQLNDWIERAAAFVNSLPRK